MTTFLMWYFGGVVVAYYSLKLAAYVIDGQSSFEDFNDFLNGVKYSLFSWVIAGLLWIFMLAVIVERNFSAGPLKDWWEKVKNTKVPKWL